MDAVPEIPGQARPHIETVGHIDELIIAPKIWHQLDQASLHRRIMDLARADPYATLRGMIEEVVDDVTPVGTLIRTNSPFNPEVEIRYARAARVAQFFAENHAPIGGYDCDTPLMAVLSTIRLLFDKRYSKRWFEVDRKDDYMLDTSFFEMLENMGFYEAIKPVDYQQVLNELESDDRIIQRG
ncbi:hypothetical protein JW868_03300, partial [Candidatus Woesearchaeota archaeon]|nr:hypothetical protein [Candidatus Woesearchaeota archaeon]